MKRYVTLAAACTLAVLLLSSGVPPAAPVASAAQSPAIRVAPAAPVFADAERQAELRARRARVAQEVGPKGLAVFFSAEPRLYTNDVVLLDKQLHPALHSAIRTMRIDNLVDHAVGLPALEGSVVEMRAEPLDDLL